MATIMRRQPSRQQQPVARWTSFGDLEQIQQQLQQLVNATIPGVDPEIAQALWSPPVDIEETEDAWIVEAEIPGVKHDDVDVQMRDNELVVRGEVKEKERAGILRRRTRKVGEFEYRVTLPGDVDAENIQANLDHGVLEIRVPKAERARSRHIQVTAAAGDGSPTGGGQPGGGGAGGGETGGGGPT
jgi:HSP20 family protein